MNLIDRDALIANLREHRENVESGGHTLNVMYCIGLDNAISRIEEQPTIDAAPVVHGEWVNIVGGFFEMGRCSVCGGQWPTAGGLNYCPNCGAKMDATDNNVGNK